MLVATNNLVSIVGGVAIVISVAALGATLAAAIRGGAFRALKSLQFGTLSVVLADRSTETDEIVDQMLVAKENRLRDLTEDRDRATSRQTTDEAEPDVEAEPDIEADYRLLRAYHELGLAQSRVSFWFSLVFASLGFALIAVSVVTAQTNDLNRAATVVPIVAGAIVDAIAGLFFVQSNRARQLMAGFFDRLREDRRMQESIQVADTISDDDLRSRVKVVLALNLAGVDTSRGQLEVLITPESSTRDAELTVLSRPPKEDRPTGEHAAP